MKAFLQAALEALIPPVCAACGDDVPTWSQVACRACQETFDPFRGPHCVVCGAPFIGEGSSGERPCGGCAAQPPPFRRARAFGAYGAALEELIIAFKFHGRRDLAAPLAGLLCLALDEEYIDPDLVAPVPLSRRRLRARGYDQAWLLARATGRILGVDARPRALRRVRHTPPQSSLTSSARRQNVRGAFEPGPDGVVGLNVLLIDDVMTTGATVSECASALTRAGAARVQVATVARSV